MRSFAARPCEYSGRKSETGCSSERILPYAIAAPTSSVTTGLAMENEFDSNCGP